MCGIAGWIAPAGRAPEERALQPMLDSIYHRGPDGSGTATFVAGRGAYRVALGHRRLAIIDPNGSAQPMRDAEAGLALTFNGEIFNFRELREALEAAGIRFQRDSDTEVLLRAYQYWGPDCVHHLRGQFAFAIWDARNERLFMARDRFGEKPLYLYESGGGVYFASEMKALLTLPGIGRDIDPTAVWDYLAYRYVPGPRTLFRAIRKLPPATAGIWEKGSFRETRYWVPPDAQPLERPWTLSDAETVSAFLKQMDEAVRLQMVSDVPFGAFLSGGIDSSVVVALMSRYCAQVKTFSVGFEGDSRYSELGYAATVARRFNTEHTELEVTQRDFMERLPQLVASRDAPVSEPSDVAIFLLAREASKSVKMVLTGEGSDEVLGGYRKHVAEAAGSLYYRVPRLLRRGVVAPLIGALPFRFRQVKIAAASLACEDWRERYVRWFGAMDFAQRKTLAQLADPGGEVSGPPFDAGDPGALRRVLYFDQTSWLPDNLLERGDRMSMAASIEARLPFLDHKLVEFVSGLPDRWRVQGMGTKRVLRQAARSLLPREILTRKKVGFRAPVDVWFAEGMRDYLYDHLSSPDSLTRSYYEPRELDRLLSEHTRGIQPHDKLLWTLLTLEIWHRQYCKPVAAKEDLACAA